MPARVVHAADAEVHASQVSFDGERQEVVLDGDVRVDSPPFHLRSSHVRLRRRSGGPLEVEGEGTLGFCPCLGAPLGVRFSGAKVAPPGDLLLDRPVLTTFGVPVFWLPVFWLRAPTKPGLLPPDVAYRASDGLYAGLGAHLPWRLGENALDLRGGAYVRGGAVADVRLSSRESRAHVRIDHLRETGVVVDVRGHTVRSGLELTWDVDALRGRRALRATTRLDEASKPWDRAAADATFARGPLAVSMGARATSFRGGELGAFDAAGPTVSTVLRAASRDGRIAARADAFGAALGTAGGAQSFGRARLGTAAVGELGPLVARSRAEAEAGAASVADGADGMVSGLVRTTLALPLARDLSGDGSLVHVVEPVVTGTVGTRSSGPPPLGLPPLSGDVPHRGALAGSVGARSLLGVPATSTSIELTLALGVATTEPTRAVAGAHARLGARHPLVAAAGEGAWVDRDTGEGGALYAGVRGRLGREEGARLHVHAAFATASDAFAARRLGEGGADVPAPYLAARTSWVGGRGVLPVARRVSLMAGADGDLEAVSLLGAFGGVELRDACQCFVLRALGSRRIGRDGVDVWLSLDILGDAPRR